MGAWIRTLWAAALFKTEAYERLRHVRSVLEGDDLRRMGVEPGRIYRQILERLRDARLDGEITTRARRKRVSVEFLTKGVEEITTRAQEEALVRAVLDGTRD